MTTDPITTEVVANALKALIYEMDAAIERTAMSVIIREQHDFGMSLVDATGRVVVGTPFAGRSLSEFARERGVEPGDVVMFNDPYLSHGEISHLGDTMVAVPIFWQDHLIAWGIAWGHHMDIGAAAPAAMPSSATEIYHEGLQIPPVKLYARGELNRDVLAIVARNSRTPEMMVGDTLALSAAGKVAEKRLHELCGKFGASTVLGTFEVLFERARATMRRLIELIPAEPVSFEDVLDHDGIVDEPLTIRLSLRRAGDRLIADYTGTSPQCTGPVNLPLNPGLQKMRLYNMLRLAGGHRIAIDPALDANQGVEELVEMIIPPGCLLNPTHPAPVSLRHLTVGRLIDVTQGVLAQIFPESVPAPSNGSLNCYSLLGWGRTEADRWLCFEVTAAGGGARPFGDGIDAYCWNNRLKNAPAEFVEAVYPVRIEQYTLRPGSAGAGRQRGGYGLVRAIRTLRPARLYYLDERQRTQPWGLRGGRPAAPNEAYLEHADGTIIRLPGKFDGLPVGANDLFVMQTGGGGGWGDPCERDPEAVRREVERGLLTVAEAREWYGVAVAGSPPAVDAEATARLRAAAAPRTAWLDRGVPQPSPAPGDFHTTVSALRPR